MENYEALGRYMAAKEKARSLESERYEALEELSFLIADALESPIGDVFIDFNHQRATQLFEAVKELHTQMMVAIQDANQFAEAAGRPVIRVTARA